MTRVGSGVLVNYRGETFIFSSAHVIEHRGAEVLRFSIGEELIEVSAEIYTTPPDSRGSHTRDLLDCLVLRIVSPIPAYILAGALREEEMAGPSTNCLYLTTGYPLKKFSERERNLIIKPTALLTDVERAGLRIVGGAHVVVRNELQMVKDGTAVAHKSLQGISGGGLFLVHGIAVDVDVPVMETLTLRLVAIIVEHRKRTVTGPASLVCTSVGCHVSLADQILEGELCPALP